MALLIPQSDCMFPGQEPVRHRCNTLHKEEKAFKKKMEIPIRESYLCLCLPLSILRG